MEAIDTLVNGVIGLIVQFWHWTTWRLWIDAGIALWLSVAYLLWTHIPTTPHWSAFKLKPMVWWRALVWPVYWPAVIIAIIGYVCFHLVKGLFWWMFVDRIKARLTYGRELRLHPEVEREDGYVPVA